MEYNKITNNSIFSCTSDQAINDIVNKTIGARRIGNKNGFQYVYLVGAGASVASNIPDAFNMCKEIREKFKEIKDDEIEQNIKNGMSKYQATFFEARKYTDDKFLSRFVRDQIKKARRPKPDYRWIINNFYNTLAEILVECKFFSGLILTTNFDPLLYYAFIQNWSTEPSLIRHYEEIKSMRPQDVLDEFPAIIYLHGYWQNHWLYHEPSELEQYAKQWKSVLSQYFYHDVIVVGYSGLEDSIAIDWLKECLNNNQTIWWCIHCPNDNVERDNYRYIELIRRKVGDCNSKKLKIFPIKNAEQFILDLGSGLNLMQARKIQCLYSIFNWFKPINIDQFSNGASLRFDTKGYLTLNFKMGNDPFPGNNHAGINIDTVYYELCLKRFKKLRIFYNVNKITALKTSPGFEFKLHSINNAWSYHVPFEAKEGYHEIPLIKFSEQGVDLDRIWRIVIAVDVKCLGKDGECTIKIYNTELLD